MKLCIATLVIISVAVVIGFSTFFYINYGWPALVAYLVFAVIYAMPTIVTTYRWHKEKGGVK